MGVDLQVLGELLSATWESSLPVRRVHTAQTEREGFEPSNEVDPRYAISNRARSTAPAPLQRCRRAMSGATAPIPTGDRVGGSVKATTRAPGPLLGSAQCFSR
jgi:hypothetical protein